MTAVDEIKNRLDIVDVVSETVSLRRSGRNYSGFCPFHSNTKTPSFYVFPDTQTWHCFGACSEGGDLFNFVMKRENLDFKEALTELARQAGVELESHAGQKQQNDAQKSMLALLAEAADYFHMLFLSAPEAETARQYVQGRALDEETIAHYKVGFALNRWDAVRTHFLSKGYDENELLAAGLLTQNEEKGTRYDRFRNRLMIPIRNLGGDLVGFGARTLEPDGIPKYLNSPQTAVFDKSSILFGLNDAKRHIREARQVVIVEGYLDVMTAWQAGFRNVVAQMGTALTQDQMQQLKRYSKRFVLALDADAAGANATMRSLQVARETLDRDVDVRFDARGLVLHEGHLQADIRVVSMPEGKDPDNIIRENASDWPKLLEQARPVVQYVIDTLTADLDLQDAKAKTAVAQQILPLIREIAAPLERDHYWQALARALRTDEKVLRQVSLPVKQQKRPYVPPGQTVHQQQKKPTPDNATGSRYATAIREENFLRRCIQQPMLLTRVNQRLLELEMETVVTNDFTQTQDRELFVALMRAIRKSSFAATDDLWDSLDESLIDRIEDLRASQSSPETDLERLADKLALSVLDWRHEKITRLVNEVRQLFRESPQVNDADSQTMYQQLQSWRQAMLKIHRAKDAMSATSNRRNGR